MITPVLDTSVALEWALPMANETLPNQALRPLQRHRDGAVEFIAAGRNRERAAEGGAEGTLDQTRRRNRSGSFSLAAISPPVLSRELLSEATAIAYSHDRNIFECFYAALRFKREPT